MHIDNPEGQAMLVLNAAPDLEVSVPALAVMATLTLLLEKQRKAEIEYDEASSMGNESDIILEISAETIFLTLDLTGFHDVRYPEDLIKGMLAEGLIHIANVVRRDNSAGKEYLYVIDEDVSMKIFGALCAAKITESIK